MKGRGHIVSGRYQGRMHGCGCSLHTSHWARLKGNNEVNVNMLGRSCCQGRRKENLSDVALLSMNGVCIILRYAEIKFIGRDTCHPQETTGKEGKAGGIPGSRIPGH